MPKKTDESKSHIQSINPNVSDMISRALALSQKPAPTADIQATTNINVLVPAFGSNASSSAPPNVLGPNEQMENDSTAQPPTENDVGQASYNWRSSKVSIGQGQAHNQVCNFLKDDEVGMVGIHGMGGVGKTKLMEKVDEEFLTPSYFKVIWITVSKTVDMDAIQEVIMRKLDLCFHKHDNTHNRAKEINDALQMKKVALLFDDIWKCLDLEQLGILGPKKLDTRSFKLIFTTRSDVVCEQMKPDRLIKVQCLGWDDSWALFKISVKDNDIERFDSGIVELAIKVAKECNGLPLALKVIGGAMAGKKRVGEWRHALDILRRCPTDIPDAEECLFAHLKFSFDSLSNSREKACFLHACLYPEDTSLRASLLVECWIGEGILSLNGSYQEAFDEGINIFGTLQAACLFETFNDSEFEWGRRTRIHDVIRDMGNWIAKREPHRFSVWYDVEWPDRAVRIDLTTFIPRSSEIIRCTFSCFALMSKLRVIILHSVKFDGSPTSIGELTELRHLELISVSPEGLPNEIRNLRKLHVMCYNASFSSREMIDLPEEIGELIELRKLDVRGIRTVPTQIGNLHKLEDLVIHGRAIKELPKTVPQLSELRKLNVSLGNASLRTLPVDIGKLKKLEELWISCKLDELLRCPIGQLVSLKELSIIHEEEDMVDEVAFASFLTKLSGLPLISLQINCFPIKEFQVPPTSNTSCIFPRLRRVCILLFHHLEKMQVMSPMALPSIRILEISMCNSLKHISGLEHLQSLETLQVFSCKNLATLICFPKLKQLQCSHLPQLKSICSDTVSFPSLLVLKISSCDSLKHISGLEHLQSLETLRVSDCKNLGEVIEVAREEADHSPPIYFPKLKQLKCWLLPQVKSICSDTVSFPSLQDFYCSECPGLTRLPRGLVKKNGAAPEKCLIVSKRKWYNKLQWQDRDFKAALDPHISIRAETRQPSYSWYYDDADSEDDASNTSESDDPWTVNVRDGVSFAQSVSFVLCSIEQDGRQITNHEVDTNEEDNNVLLGRISPYMHDDEIDIDQVDEVEEEQLDREWRMKDFVPEEVNLDEPWRGEEEVLTDDNLDSFVDVRELIKVGKE